MEAFKYLMVVHEENGRYWAWFPELPGCFTDGDTLEELRRNAKEAVYGVLSLRHDEGREIPQGVGDGVIETLLVKNNPAEWKKGVRMIKSVEAV